MIDQRLQHLLRSQPPDKPIDIRIFGERAPSVMLDAAVLGDDPQKPVWIQLAMEGDWAGHHQGEFSFDARKFDTMTGNFRKNPTYVQAPGTADVIPFDWAHASEMDPTSGSLPVTGAPAWAWLREVERKADPTGKATFWGLTDVLEPAREYIKTRRLKWVSLSVWFDAVDFVTSEPIGPLITSVAFTNNPFLKGMVPITMSARALAARAGGARDLAYYGGAACSPEQVVDYGKSLFGVKETEGVGALIAEVQKLRSYVEGGQTPVGVDIEKLMRGLRDILACKPLDDDATVFAEFDKLLPALAAREAADVVEDSARVASTNTYTAPRGALTDQGENTMSIDLKTLCARYGLAANATEHDLIIKLDANAKEAGASNKLAAILKALGVEDGDGAMARITDVLKQAADLTAAWPELAELVKGQVDDEEKGAEDDVEKAMATYGLPADAKFAMLAMRTGSVELAEVRLPFNGDLRNFTETQRRAALSALSQRRAARARFATKYPPREAPQGGGQFSHLTSPLVSRPPGGPTLASGAAPLSAGSALGRIAASGFDGGMQRPGQQLQASPPMGNGAINLAAYPGANWTLKAMAYIKSQPGSADMSHDDLHARAAQIVDELSRTGALSAMV